MNIPNDSALERRARRVAKTVGLLATKSRWRLNSVDNYGGFQIVDPYFNRVEAGLRYDMSAQDVIEYCQGQKDSAAKNELVKAK